MFADGYYLGSLGTPPKTPYAESKILYSGQGCKSPPLFPGYFTPPDSRENSPSLGGTSPNPQSTFLLPPTPGSPLGSSSDVATLVQYSSKTSSRSQGLRISDILQEECFGSPKSTTSGVTEDAFRSALQLSGSQPTQGTFGRADNRRYQNQRVPESLPQAAKFARSPIHRHRRSDASTIVPLPSTVYVPGVGDNVSSTVPSHDTGDWRHDYHDRVVNEPSRFSVCDTPPLSAKSPSMSSPFLPVEPDTPVAPGPDMYGRTSLVSSQSGLIGLWKSAQGNENIAGNASDGGRTYALNMYRQTPLCKSEHSPALPEHFTFGSDPGTPFYTLYAMREGPGDDDFNELSFLRRDPISGLETSVITLGLESPSQRIYPTGDGLITLIYPKEAVLSAMSPTTPVIRDDDGKIVSPRRIRGNEERTREAIQRAYATECCRLSWNAQRSRYYLYHPGIGVCGDAYLVDILGEVGFDNVGAKGTIKLLNVDTNETITELDFGRGTLFVNTSATSKIPSAHIVDVAVATVLTIAVIEGRRVRMPRKKQSQFSARTASGNVDNEYSGGRWRGYFSAFLKSLCF